MLKITAVVLGVLLLTVSVTTVVDMDQSADAAKAQKKGIRHQHTHNVGNKVCGDELCSGAPYVKRIR